MEIYGFVFIFVPIICLLITLHFLFKNDSIRSLKILSSLMFNIDRLHDAISETLQQTDGTVLMKSAFLLNVDMLITGDPKNVYHIMNKEFSSYPKGPEWRKRFGDVFGDSMFNADFEEWNYHRGISRAFFSDQQFHQTTFKIVQDVIKEGLVPFLKHASEKGLVLDLRDVFERLTYDVGCEMVGGIKSRSLGVAVARPRFLRAIDDACEVILSRHFRPEILWRLQRWLNIGKEKKMRAACEALDRVFKESFPVETKVKDVAFSAIGTYLANQDLSDGQVPSNCYKTLKDIFLTSVFAVEDNTSITICWFFYVMSKYPDVESKVKEEVSRIVCGRPISTLDTKYLNKMVYLHACLCETLRLYPAVPMEVRAPIKPDVLPSGHRVNQKMIVAVSAYAMGRMSNVWGDDCLEFKPERWITEDGRIKHEPSHKFFAFLSGPRICPGKDFAFMVMKMVVATVFRDFDVQVIPCLPVVYEPSIVLQMKHGLTAKLCRKAD